jgi:hypothetical protein
VGCLLPSLRRKLNFQLENLIVRSRKTSSNEIKRRHLTVIFTPLPFSACEAGFESLEVEGEGFSAPEVFISLPTLHNGFWVECDMEWLWFSFVLYFLACEATLSRVNVGSGKILKPPQNSQAPLLLRTARGEVDHTVTFALLDFCALVR